jgi:arginyl-tRNA synthetase
MENGVKSRYIVGLIRKDMKGSSGQYVTMDELMEILESRGTVKEKVIDDDVEGSLLNLISL